MTRSKKQEYVLYLILWTVVFAAAFFVGKPLRILPFFILFLIHQFLILPLYDRKRKWMYFTLAGALVALFAVWLFALKPAPGDIPPRPDHMEMRGPRPGLPDPGFRPGEAPGPDGERFRPDDAPERPDGAPMRPEQAPARPDGLRPGPPPSENAPVPPEGKPFAPELMQLLIALMMLAVNAAIRVFFTSSENRRRLEELEKENLSQQLQYLRYQINPHFFMNTLNNIHALVDIDPEQAKLSILELSKLMRYILYEGSQPTIPLSKETDFLSHYVSLMRMRYAENVKINVRLPEETGDAQVPPLIFVTFVENAFKHGISYEQECYIDVSMALEEGKLVFKCANSRHQANTDNSRGIGLENVRKRLELLYGKDFTLHVDSTPGVYDILVIIPV